MKARERPCAASLHAQKILHRDVKTANVLRMSGEVVKLAGRHRTCAYSLR